MKNILMLLIIVIITSSCYKGELVTLPVKIVEVINPPGAPEIYLNSSVEPEIKIKNTGSLDITSIAIAYYIDMDNCGCGYSIGPTTTWFGTIKPNEEAVIILDKWESYAGRQPLKNGTHMLFLNVTQINTDPYYDDNYELIKRLFILEK
jgi:hypothetical protein